MGFYVDTPQARTGAIPEFVGPVVLLGVCTPTTWNAYVFVACKHTHVTFSWGIEGQQAGVQVPAEPLDSAGGWYFFRFPISNVQQEWNMVAYSCYDQRRAVGEALWRNINEKAADAATPVHALLGGGDQLYNDNIWGLDILNDWLKLPTAERLTIPPSKEMVAAVEDFYLMSYVGHTHFHPAAELLRGTPQHVYYKETGGNERQAGRRKDASARAPASAREPKRRKAKSI